MRLIALSILALALSQVVVPLAAATAPVLAVAGGVGLLLGVAWTLFFGGYGRRF